MIKWIISPEPQRNLLSRIIIIEYKNLDEHVLNGQIYADAIFMWRHHFPSLLVNWVCWPIGNLKACVYIETWKYRTCDWDWKIPIAYYIGELTQLTNRQSEFSQSQKRAFKGLIWEVSNHKARSEVDFGLISHYIYLKIFIYV